MPPQFHCPVRCIVTSRLGCAAAVSWTDGVQCCRGLRRRLRHWDRRCVDPLGPQLRHPTCTTTGCSQQIGHWTSGDVHYVQTRFTRYARPGAPRKRFLMKRVLQSKKRLGSRVPGFGEKASLRDIAAPTCAGFLVMQGPPLQVRNSGPGHGDSHCCAVQPGRCSYKLEQLFLIVTGCSLMSLGTVLTSDTRGTID